MTLVLLAALIARPDVDPEPPDTKRVQGTWKVVRAELFGTKFEADRIDIKRLRFDGDKVIHPDKNNKVWAKFKLDPKQRPRHIDMTDDNGKTQYGIYKIEKDRLTIAVFFDNEKKERPGAFDSEKGSLMILDREK
jgi:uncharacterized protein (TIGR03067 family)